MAKRRRYAKKRKSSRKQGITSWATSVISLGIGLSNVIARIADSLKQPEGERMKAFGYYMMQDYTGCMVGSDGYFDFNAKRLFRGWMPIIGAIAFKKGTSYMMKVAKVKSLIPRLSAG